MRDISESPGDKEISPCCKIPQLIQGNLQRNQAADAILEQLVCETTARIMAVSEPYRIKINPPWLYDRLGTAAVWIPVSRGIRILGHWLDHSHVWVRLRHVTVYSIYLSPKYSAQEYREKFELLEDSLQNVPGLSHCRWRVTSTHVLLNGACPPQTLGEDSS